MVIMFQGRWGSGPIWSGAVIQPCDWGPPFSAPASPASCCVALAPLEAEGVVMNVRPAEADPGEAHRHLTTPSSPSKLQGA